MNKSFVYETILLLVSTLVLQCPCWLILCHRAKSYCVEYVGKRKYKKKENNKEYISASPGVLTNNIINNMELVSHSIGTTYELLNIIILRANLLYLVGLITYRTSLIILITYIHTYIHIIHIQCQSHDLRN